MASQKVAQKVSQKVSVPLAAHCAALSHIYAKAGVSGLINKHEIHFDGFSEADPDPDPLKAALQPKTTIRLPAAQLKVASASETSENQKPNPFYHGANALHGCVYFKMLDDAAFFAAQAAEQEFFVLTTNFTMDFFRPVTVESMGSDSQALIATGSIVNATRGKGGVVVAESALVEESSGKLVAKGRGSFMRGRARLMDMPGYAATVANWPRAKL